MSTDIDVANAQAVAPHLWQFQNDFGNYLRRQTDATHIPTRVGKLYQSLIWNNFTGFINQCFPICRQLINDETWQQLQHTFFNEGQLETPYFGEISQQFVIFLQKNPKLMDKLALPLFFVELAHYEWIELYVDNLVDKTPTPFIKNLALNPSVQPLHYQWAVQTISSNHQPDTPEETFLLVYRKMTDTGHEVAFMQVNALTYLLVAFISEGGVYENDEQLFVEFAKAVAMPAENFLGFAQSLFETLLENQVLLSV